MKVNVNSWHYKVYDFQRTTFSGQLNLCSYIRGVVNGALKIALFIVFGVMGSIWVLELPVTGLMYLVTGQFLQTGFFLGWIHPDAGVMVLFSSFILYTLGSLTLAGMALILLVIHIFETIASTFKEMKELQAETEPTRFTKLLVEYFKAVKQKTCPLIERDYVERDYGRKT